MEGKRRASLIFIFITLFLDILGIGLIVPQLPMLVSHFFGNNVSQGAWYYGILLTSYAVMQFLFSPLLGALSDRFGRRPVLLISTFGSGIDYLVMAVAPGFYWLLAARMISGMSGANITVGMAYIADITPPEKRAQSFGLVGASFGLGFILGPALGGWLGSINMAYPFYLAAGMTLLNFLYGLLVLPESLKPEHREPLDIRKANPLGALRMLTSSRVIMNLALIFLLANLAQKGIESNWVLFTAFRFHWTPAQNGMSLAAVGLCSALVQGGLMRSAMPRWGEKKVMLYGLTAGIVTFVLFGLASKGWMMYPIIVFNSLVGMAGPAAQGILSRQVGPNEQGALQGAMASLGTVTRAFGPLMSTSLFAYFTTKGAPIVLPGIPFFLGAVLLVASFIATLYLFRRFPEVNRPKAPEASVATAGSTV